MSMVSLPVLVAAIVSNAGAQEAFLNPNASCSITTNKTTGANPFEKKLVIPHDGTVLSIGFADDGFDDPNLDAEVSGSCRQEGNKVTISAKGKVVNRSSGVNDTRASAGFSATMGPHAKPINSDYIIGAQGAFKVTWDRGGADKPGEASASISMSPCPAPNNGIGVSAGPAAAGSLQQGGTVQCLVRSGDPFGFLGTNIPVGMSATVNQQAGVPQEFAFEGNVVFSLEPAGRVLRMVAGDGQREIVGHRLPLALKVHVLDRQPYQVSVVSGVPVSFSVLPRPNGVADAFLTVTATQTDASGVAASQLTLGNGTGTYVVRATCPSCHPTQNSVDFTEVAVTTDDVTALREFFCDGTGFAGQPMPYPMRVRAVDTKSGKYREGLDVSFQLGSAPGGAALLDAGGNPGGSVTDATNKHGLARASLKLGASPGQHTVTASCARCKANPVVNCPVEGIAATKQQMAASPIGPLQKSTEVFVLVTPPVVASRGAGSPNLAEVTLHTALGNTLVSARIVPVDYSGGHQHVAGRPTGIFTQTGTNAWTGKTGADGTFLLTYLAGEVGGEEAIETTAADGAIGREFVLVRVVGLVPLRRRGANHASVSNDKLHANFLYGLPSLNATIETLAAEYVKISTGPLMISLNDMSLISGGVFDSNHNWQSKHASHRAGVDVDINGASQFLAPPNKPKTDADFEKNLCRIVRDKNLGCCKIVEKGSIHFRCPCGGAPDDCARLLQ